MATKTATKTIVLVHGNFVNYECWDVWVPYLEERGYTVTRFHYPGRDGSVQELRAAHPDPKVGELTIEQTLDALIALVKSQPEKPLVIGHSFGGMLTQLIVNRDLAVAGIPIDSVPPAGILSFEWSFLRSTFPVTNFLVPSSRPYLMPFSHFQYSFANALPLEAQKTAYEKTITPESLRLSRGGLGSKAKVDFSKPHAPLLFISGEKDHIMPASLNLKTANAYRKGNPASVTDQYTFKGRDHMIIGEPGWEEVAEYALTWAARQGV